MYLSLAELKAGLPGQLLKVPGQDAFLSFLLCLGDQYLRDNLHKNIKLLIGDCKLLRGVNRIADKLL